jgi:prepilin-type N-terminal cleavage/methylation domain-containing protein
MRRQKAKGKSQRGFTLLEVVVAMSIVTLGVVTLFEVFSLALRLGARSAAKTEAITLSREVIDEALVLRKVREGMEEGSFGGEHRWKLQVEPFQKEDEIPLSEVWGLKEITLQMQYGEGGSRQVEVKTLHLVKEQGR